MESDFSYNLIRRPKRKTLSIIIRSNNDVDVLVPARTPVAFVDQFVSSKSAWIKQKLHFNSQIKSPHKAKAFKPGELFQLMGAELILEIRMGKRAVKNDSEKLIVSLPLSTRNDKKTDIIRSLIEKWYRDQAEIHLDQRSKQLAEIIGKSPTHIGVKGYKSRWGSCHIDGRIFFNWRLIMAPAWVIDYVVLHELCHLIHHNHSRNYWNLVESIMPDYRNAQSWLKVNGATLEL
ncbi:hypothetical protein Ga0123461_1481 [Mariprofundus aestuarium]|uniref:YgjP-like metallopeptidase domain-containing protein n=1 Tax=Mariprofundus aestuarium TaxID=1921086 RepID=A0A2K8KY44_MARES|nr:SprT family zinc-dependent metalloprotease [Mariprofundus aestuarium]ATX79895.1 hypothetical protein Ga0123461_1481 [Mariprofundus aestuarium]